jgi:hypothetical protein
MLAFRHRIHQKRVPKVPRNYLNSESHDTLMKDDDIDRIEKIKREAMSRQTSARQQQIATFSCIRDIAKLNNKLKIKAIDDIFAKYELTIYDSDKTTLYPRDRKLRSESIVKKLANSIRKIV